MPAYAGSDKGQQVAPETSKKDEGFDYSGMAGGLAKTGLPVILSWLLNKDDRKRKGTAESQQLAISEAIFNMMKQRNTADMELRNPLFGALRNRMEKKEPRFTPGQVALTNPYRNVQRMQRIPQPPPQMPAAGFNPEMLRNRMQSQQFQGAPARDPLGALLKAQMIGRPEVGPR